MSRKVVYAVVHGSPFHPKTGPLPATLTAYASGHSKGYDMEYDGEFLNITVKNHKEAGVTVISVPKEHCSHFEFAKENSK